MTDKLTVEDIKGLLKDRKEYYQKLHDEQKDCDNYYELTFDAGLPSILNVCEQRTPSTARDWVDIGVRNFTLDNPKSVVWPRGLSDAAREKDAILGSFYNFWLRRSILKIKDASKKLLLRGEVFIKVGMLDTYLGEPPKGMTLGEFEEKRLMQFPLTMDVPDPINVYCSTAQNELVPVDVIECYNMTVAEARNLCKRNNWNFNTEMKSTGAATWLSYWGDDWRCFMLGESKEGSENLVGLQPVLKGDVQPNLLQFCPYVHVPSGLGQTSYEGKPEYLYRPILYSKRDMFKLESRGLTYMDAISGRYAMPKHKIIGEEEDVKPYYPDGKVSSDPLVAIRETKNVQVELMEGMTAPPGLFEQLAVVAGMAQPPAALSGNRPSGVYSAQGFEDLVATAKPIYKDVFKNLEDGLAIVMGMGARIIDRVYKHDVAIKDFASPGKRAQKQIRPGDIDGHYDCEVQLLAEPPEATAIRKTSGTNYQKAGVISHKTNLKTYFDMSEEEADDEQAQIIAEQALREPGVREAAAMDALHRLGMTQTEEEIAQTQKSVAGSIPPRRQPETVPPATQMVRRQGVLSPEMSNIPATQEAEMGAIPMGR